MKPRDYIFSGSDPTYRDDVLEVVREPIARKLRNGVDELQRLSFRVFSSAALMLTIAATPQTGTVAVGATPLQWEFSSSGSEAQRAVQRSTSTFFNSVELDKQWAAALEQVRADGQDPDELLRMAGMHFGDEIQSGEREIDPLWFESDCA